MTKRKTERQTMRDILDEWVESFHEVEAAYKKLKDAFGASPESSVVAALYNPHGKYTRLVAEKVGDEDGWLEWYLWDNYSGKRGLKAKAVSWKRDRRIRNTTDLAALISGCEKGKQ